MYNLKLVHDRLVRYSTIPYTLDETLGESRGKAEKESDVGLGRKAGGAAYGFKTPPIVPQFVQSSAEVRRIRAIVAIL